MKETRCRNPWLASCHLWIEFPNFRADFLPQGRTLLIYSYEKSRFFPTRRVAARLHKKKKTLHSPPLLVSPVVQKIIVNGVGENTFLKIYLPSAKRSKLPSHQVFAVFELQANEILQATPPKLRDASEIEKGHGDVRQSGDYN